MHSLLADIRYALRGFLQNPGLTLAAVLSLAIAIGGNYNLVGDGEPERIGCASSSSTSTWRRSSGRTPIPLASGSASAI